MIPDNQSRDLAHPRSQLSGLEIAMQWADLPAEHLATALKALEPQLKREHEYRMYVLEAEQREHAYRMAQLEAEEQEKQRAHQLHQWGLIAGAVLTVLMLAGAVFLAIAGQTALAVTMIAMSLSLGALFVLRKAPSGKATRAVPTPQADPLQDPGTAPSA